jgi:hypothetical protein
MGIANPRKNKRGFISVSEGAAGGRVLFPMRRPVRMPLTTCEARQSAREYFWPAKRIYLNGLSRLAGDREALLAGIFGQGNFRVCAEAAGDWLEIGVTGPPRFATYLVHSRPYQPGWIALVRPRRPPTQAGEPPALIEWVGWLSETPPWVSKWVGLLADPDRWGGRVVIGYDHHALLEMLFLADEDPPEDPETVEPRPAGQSS